MNIWLIRHTKVALKFGICYGQSNVDVADTFIDEAKEIKVQLADTKFDKVYSSPLLRCKKLSEYLFNSDIHIDNRLMELNFGYWELQEWDQIKHPDIDRWMTDFVNTPCPNGESFLDMHNRVVEFISELNTNNDNIAIIAHGGTIRNIITHIKNEDLKDAFKREINYGEIIKLKI
ncbi:MAG: alpha-ribazole phosphatase [Bacteroidales bacterium]|nr:alpha-ribazole phosphatase [Bacteroidales bacterium]